MSPRRWTLDDLPPEYQEQVKKYKLSLGGSTPRLTEAEFQERVIHAAKTLGWLTYHTYDSRRSEPGFPDLVLSRHGRLIFAELKSYAGVCSDAQQKWLASLELTGNEVFVWRPQDMDAILRVLR